MADGDPGAADEFGVFEAAGPVAGAAVGPLEAVSVAEVAFDGADESAGAGVELLLQAATRNARARVTGTSLILRTTSS